MESCILCERLDHTMERYVYTLLYMYEHEKAFREAFAASKGLCLPHYFQVMQDAPRHLSGKTLEEFSQTAMRVERENLARVEKAKRKMAEKMPRLRGGAEHMDAAPDCMILRFLGF